VDIKGIKESINALEELDNKVQRQFIKKALRAGAKEILQGARAEAPVNTGLLKSKIKVRAGKSGKGSTHITVGVGAKDFTGEAFYAAFILYGWKHGPRALGDARKKIPANNFLLRAYDAEKSNAVSTTTDTLQDLIQGEANR
jgi:HK97 gp10 family phage protein